MTEQEVILEGQQGYERAKELLETGQFEMEELYVVLSLNGNDSEPEMESIEEQDEDSPDPVAESEWVLTQPDGWNDKVKLKKGEEESTLSLNTKKADIIEAVYYSGHEPTTKDVVEKADGLETGYVSAVISDMISHGAVMERIGRNGQHNIIGLTDVGIDLVENYITTNGSDEDVTVKGIKGYGKADKLKEPNIEKVANGVKLTSFIEDRGNDSKTIYQHSKQHQLLRRLKNDKAETASQIAKSFDWADDGSPVSRQMVNIRNHGLVQAFESENSFKDLRYRITEPGLKVLDILNGKQNGVEDMEKISHQ